MFGFTLGVLAAQKITLRISGISNNQRSMVFGTNWCYPHVPTCAVSPRQWYPPWIRFNQVQSGGITNLNHQIPVIPASSDCPPKKKKTGGKKSSWAEQTRDSSATSCPQAGFQPEKDGKWVGMNISMAVSGTGGTCVQYKAYVRAKFQGTSTKYGLIWYSTSILGSWNSHWLHHVP